MRACPFPASYLPEAAFRPSSPLRYNTRRPCPTTAARTGDQTIMTADDNKAALTAFYRQALTVNTETTPGAVLERVLADDFASVNGKGTKSKGALMAQIEGFWKLIPNLTWEPQEIVISGAKHVVRSIASGNPVGEFMGLSLDGSRGFRIDTIDIHTVENGKITGVYHLEDWATGIAQLKQG